MRELLDAARCQGEAGGIMLRPHGLAPIRILYQSPSIEDSSVWLFLCYDVEVSGDFAAPALAAKG